MSLLALAAGTGTAIAGGFNAIGNYKRNKEMMELNRQSVNNQYKLGQQANEIDMQNLNFQKEKYKYDQGIQQTIFDREDNAAQRRAADLEKAGLSKTLAAGNAAKAGQAVSTQAPQQGTTAIQQKALANQLRMDAMRQKLDIARTTAQNRLINAQAIGQLANVRKTMKESKVVDATEENLRARTYGQQLTNKLENDILPDKAKRASYETIIREMEKNKVKALDKGISMRTRDSKGVYHTRYYDNIHQAAQVLNIDRELKKLDLDYNDWQQMIKYGHYRGLSGEMQKLKLFANTGDDVMRKLGGQDWLSRLLDNMIGNKGEKEND